MLIRAVDLFCGAGGLSRGIMDAAEERGHKLDLTAVNHWTTALNSHSLNHPTVRHICEPVENLWPARVIPSRHLHLLAAGVECTFHSNARGGGPCKEQSRSQAWQLIRWLTDIRVDNVLIENVREFKKWGPLYPCTCGAQKRWERMVEKLALKPNEPVPVKLHQVTHRPGFNCLKPIPKRAGEFFKNFLQTIAGLGYSVDHRIQCAADYGDPTSRERFILLARRKGAEIAWPQQTHFDPSELSMKVGRDSVEPKSKRTPWRTARECIDFSIEGTSVFNRKKPLCKNTIRRIIAGLRKFGGPNAEPFIAILNGTTRSHTDSSAQSLDEPLGTVTGANRFMLVDGQIKPFVLGQHSGATPRGCDKPLPTICTAGKTRLVEPFIQHLTHQGDDKNRVHSLKKPMPTVTGAHRGEMALIESFIIPKQSKDQPRSLKKPMATITTKIGPTLVEPFILPREGFFRGNTAKSLKRPMVTVTSNGVGQLVQPIIVQTDQTGGNGSYARKIDRPLGTIVSKQNMILVEPMLVKYYGTGVAKTLLEPMDTVTTRDRFLLVECGTGRHVAELDIRTRMLQPLELAAAHSFPKHFIFTGTKEDQTKQIGNSVPRRLARAHVKVLLP